MTKTEITDKPEETRTNAKREVAAVVTSTAVTIAITVAANIFAAKVGGYVHNRVAPKTEDE
jgi:hypothetical protein